MLVYLAAVVLGLAVLVWSSDRFVYGASGTANALGVSPLLIGLTVVGIGTSAPEMLVAAMASAGGSPGLAVGNAVGSNIANIALVLGATALVVPLAVGSDTLSREFPAMLLVMVLALLLVVDGDLSLLDGSILVVATGVFMGWIVAIGVRARKEDPMTREFEAEIPADLGLPRALLITAGGLLLLLLSSRVIVWGAVNIAQAMGVSDFLVGLTIIAVGTSLPELGACIAGAVKGEPELAIGNIIGSNMFNLLPVLAIPALIAPGPVPDGLLQRDYLVMLALALMLSAMVYGLRGNRRRIGRLEGGLLLACFFGYQWLLYLTGE
jgi:cation:H+ antiporter